MASGSKQPTIEDYFSDDSAHGNEGIEDCSASIPVSRRAPSPTSQPSDPRSDSGYATTVVDLREDSYTHADYQKSQNIEYNGIPSMEEYPREEEERSSQHRPREVEAKPAQLLNKRLPTVVHSRSVPDFIVENRTRQLPQTGYRKIWPVAEDKYVAQHDESSFTRLHKISGYTGSPSKTEIPRHKTNGNWLRCTEDDDEVRYRFDASAPITLDLDRSMEGCHLHVSPVDEAGMIEIVISGKRTGKLYLSDGSGVDSLRRQTPYVRKNSSRYGQQAGTPNQSQITIIQHDDAIDDDTNNDKTGARREEPVTDSQLGIQDYTDDITEIHVLRNEVENIVADWKDVWNMIPEVWKWDLEYHTIHRADGTRHGCWTCTPLEPEEPKLYPLTIASAPVVLPVEHQWPPAAGLNPPPDPRPSTPIDCSRELPLDTIRDLFLTFEGSLGFYILISGLIQVIVPDDFDLVRETPVSRIVSTWMEKHLYSNCSDLRL
jgi:hypothetical protein